MKARKERVCHLTSVHPFDDDRIFLKQCRSLAAAGYDTHLVAPGAPGGITGGVHLHDVPTSPTSRLLRMTATAWRVYRTACRINADIYHFHDPELIPIGLLLRARGKHVVYDIHEDVPRQILLKSYLPQSTRRSIGWLVERLEYAAAHHFSGLVTATPAIGTRFQGMNPRSIVLNNYPLRNELIAPTPLAWEARAYAVAYVGSISEERGIEQMVATMAHIPEQLQVSLELAGSFSSPGVRERVVRLRGWARVRELGMLDRAGVAQVLGRVRAGLVILHPTPSYMVSQPIKLFEYMSAGIPVIASDFPLWRAFIQQSGCGLLVDPLDPRAIAGAIEFVLTHSSEAQAMGRRGRAAVEELYNWESEVPKLTHLYNHLLA